MLFLVSKTNANHLRKSLFLKVMVAINMDFTTILNQKGTPAGLSDVHLSHFGHSAHHIRLPHSPDLHSDHGAPHGVPASMMFRPTSQPVQALQPFYAAPTHFQAPPHEGPTEMKASRPAGQATAKTHLCSTCGKGFARRSDLSRHGMSSLISDPFSRIPSIACFYCLGH